MGFLKWLDERFEETCMMIALTLISLIMGYSVVARYVMNDSLSWAEEICRYLFVWSAFLSIGLCLKRRSSIKIDMLLMALPRAVQKANLFLIDVIMLLSLLYLLKGAVNVTSAMMESGQSSPALMFPMYLVFSAAVVGFGLGIIRLLQRLVGRAFIHDVEYLAQLNKADEELSKATSGVSEEEK